MKFRVFLLLIIILALLSISSLFSYSSFSDVTSGAWYENAVYFCYHNGLLSSQNQTQFGSNIPLKRGNSINALILTLGINTSSYTTQHFDDVPSSNTYFKAINWAYENNVTSGIGGGLFGINNQVTREQFCVFLYNSCVKIGFSLPTLRSGMNFTDQSDIHSWATTAINAVYRAELIDGYSDGSFSPDDVITKKQAAVILFKLYSLKNYSSGTISIFVRDNYGMPVSNASVYLYYKNTNTAYDKFPQPVIYTNSKGLASTTIGTTYPYGVNVFSNNHRQGVSNSLITPSRFTETIVLQSDLDSMYIVPFDDFRPRNYWPTTHDYIYSWKNYGYRYSGSNQYEFHQGIDIAGPCGVANAIIKSVSSGEVVASGDAHDGAGIKVQVKTSDGIYITYQHLSSTSLQPKDKVQIGTQIGRVGNTGNSYGAHLHLSFSTKQTISTSDRSFLDPISMLAYYIDGMIVNCMVYY